jgi:hypothetical protein
MEDFSFDINSLLSGEEAEALFEEKKPETETEIETDDAPAKEPETDDAEEQEAPEIVGEEKNGTEGAAPDGGGASPDTFYSSIAYALRNDGILPDFSDEEMDKVKAPEDFAELIEKAVTSKFDERMKRIDQALGNGVQPDTIRAYEQTLQYLGSINEEALSAEGDDAEDLRRQLIYNDLVNRGYTQERANREIEKSFKSGSDIDDAKEALDALTKFYRAGYENIQQEAKARAEAQKAEQKKSSEAFRKMILEDEVKVGDTALDKRTKQRIYDAISKPVYKDPDTGQLMTQVQKFQKENPMEFLKQIGLWYVLTDGGKDVSGLAKSQARVEKNKNIRELERKINASQLSPDGSLRYSSGVGSGEDPLLSDGWKVEM